MELAILIQQDRFFGLCVNISGDKVKESWHTKHSYKQQHFFSLFTGV